MIKDDRTSWEDEPLTKLSEDRINGFYMMVFGCQWILCEKNYFNNYGKLKHLENLGMNLILEKPCICDWYTGFKGGDFIMVIEIGQKFGYSLAPPTLLNF